MPGDNKSPEKNGKRRSIKLEQLDAELLIRDIFAREIFDCNGNPTVETEVLAGEGIVGRVSVPSGTGIRNGMKTGGKSYAGEAAAERTEKAVEIINTHIAQELIGQNVFDQEEIDKVLLRLDGTEDKSALGAQALFGVSAAAADAAAAALKLPLYRYLGGVHAKNMPLPAVIVTEQRSNSDNGAGKYTESRPGQCRVFLIPAEQIPLRAQLKMCMEICRVAGPVSEDIRETLRMLETAVERAGFRTGKDVTFGLDISASERYDRERNCYRFPGEGGTKDRELQRTSQELAAYYEELAMQFAVSFIKDPMYCEDWNGWVQITERLGDRIQLAGDSLFRTDIKRLEKGIEMGAANAITVRACQAGTLTGLSDVIKQAQKAGYSVSIAHNTGETSDSMIADLAVAFHIACIEAGYPRHMENIEKYNRMLRIEERIGENG